MVLYICVKFRENITNGIRVTEFFNIYDIQRAITPKID